MKLNTLIPKEQLTAYERWEMASFDEKSPELEEAIIPDESAQVSDVAPTSEEIQNIKQHAHAEGYQSGLETGHIEGQEKGYSEGEQRGYNEGLAQGWETGHKKGLEEGTQQGLTDGHAKGFKEGHDEGYAAGLAEAKAEVDEALQRLTALINNLAQDVATASEKMAPPMLDLALDISKAVLKTAIVIKPNIVLSVIKEAIRDLPNMASPIRVHLNTEDIALVKKYLEADINQEQWTLVDDPQIDRGGCRIETASNEVDATLETRWKRIADILHKDVNWLE